MIIKRNTYTTWAAIVRCAAFMVTATALAQVDPCHLHITMDPPDAIVTINGDILRGTPIDRPDFPAGRHLLIASKPGYRDLRQTLELEPGQRLVLQLKMEPLTGIILVHSEPSEADIVIDGAHRGTTPALLADLTFGTYRLQLSKAGHRTREAELVVDSRTPQRLNFNLTSDTAALRVTTTPAGATLRVNGLDRGRTPVTVAGIPEGQATVDLSLSGFHTYNDTVRLVAGDNRDLSVTLQPIPSEMTLVSIPPKARLYVNDEFKGEAPLTLEAVPPGSYRLRAELDGHETVARTIHLARATKVTEEFRLPGNVGSLHVITAPPGINVFIDGTLAGKTEGSGEQSDPLRIDDIPMGKREIALRARDRYEKRFQVEIERGRTATVQHDLQRRFVPDYEVRTRAATIQGVLVEITGGNVRLEIAPGVFRTLPAADIRGHRRLATGDDE